MTPDEIRAAVDDTQALALTLFFEGASEPVEGRIAIGCVVRNRVAHPTRYRPTYREVCTQKSQFSCWWKFGGEANFERLMTTAEAVIRMDAPKFTQAEFEIYRESMFVAEGIIGGFLRDRVRGAVNYYAPKAMVPPGRVPDWAKNRLPAAKIGNHLFFSL